ncbi:Cys-tRNA(Pro) deacylase [Naumannella huperziae]
MARRDSTGTPAIAALVAAGAAHTLHPYPHDPRSSAFGDEAVAALGLDPRHVFKTLIARVGPAGGLVCAVLPVADRLDLKAFAAAAGGKRAELADPAAAQRSSGYVVGGISPLGQRHPLPTIIDDSARAWPTIFVSAGRRGLQVELAPTDLAALTDAQWAAIAR